MREDVDVDLMLPRLTRPPKHLVTASPRFSTKPTHWSSKYYDVTGKVTHPWIMGVVVFLKKIFLHPHRNHGIDTGDLKLD